MSPYEHVLLCLAEECDEVGQRVMKALRFGLTEVQRDQPLNNAERIVDELHDLIAVAVLLERAGVLRDVYPTGARIEEKRHKIERYMNVAREQGTLSEPRP